MTKRGKSRISRAVGLVGCSLTILCIPPIAARLWALESLHPADALPLWIFSAASLAFFFPLTRGRLYQGEKSVEIGTATIVLLSLELVTRVVVLNIPETRDAFIRLGHRTYPDQMAYQPHPFLQFTGRPSVSLQGTEEFGRLSPYNQYGFLGPSLPYEKAPSTVRVACLGGSTTAQGYPLIMQDVIQARLGSQTRVEAMNFGLGWYSSAHIVVNLILNVIDYSPDYVVFHEAWNDQFSRDRTEPIRGDYSHALKVFDSPRFPDAWLLRGSLLYRFVRLRLFGRPEWAFLDGALVKDGGYRPGPRFQNPGDLWPYERNIRTFVAVAQARGIVPVLTTQPRSTLTTSIHSDKAPHIDQCNDSMRKIAAKSGDSVLFVDLDKVMTGRREDVFLDVAHTNAEGNAIKAGAIGNAIADHWMAHKRP